MRPHGRVGAGRDLVWDGYAVANRVRPNVSLADVFYLVGYPLLAAGLYQNGTAAGPDANQ